MSLKCAIGLLAAAILVLAPSAGAAQGNGRIAYMSGGSIYTVDPAGGAPTPVHDGFFPSFSPDGTRLVFAQYSLADGRYKIWVAAADGSNPVEIGRTESPHPFVWSPDGSQIAFLRGTFGQLFLYVIRPDGSGLHQLSQIPADTSFPPAWSPDAKYLLWGATEQVGYSRLGPYYHTNVYVVGADGDGERRLTDSSSLDAGSAPIWAPDGRRIAFLSTRGYGNPNRQLFVMNADGTCERQVTTGNAAVPQPTWQALAAAPQSGPLECAALSISGSLEVEHDQPALDDSRVYVYRATIANNGNVTSDPLHFVTSE